MAVHVTNGAELSTGVAHGTLPLPRKKKEQVLCHLTRVTPELALEVLIKSRATRESKEVQHGY